MTQSTTPYQELTPDRVLSCVEQLDIACNGRLLALNSYENRVYQIGREDQDPVVAKFYRPERWSDEAILEEHQFSAELAERDIPVVPPLALNGGQTLFNIDGFRFALFARKGGRAPELYDPDSLRWVGRFLGRIHALGRTQRFEHRAKLSVERLGREPVAYLLASDWLPDYLRENYQRVTEDVLSRVEMRFEQYAPIAQIRLHGDCHPGNILWTDGGPHFVDFDDCVSGPAVQDLWMLWSGDRHEAESQLPHLIGGYEEFCEFDPMELGLVESLRSLRMIHYAAWLARRWDDPAFPQAFPWFGEGRYWEEHIQSLREQLAQLDEPSLSLLR